MITKITPTVPACFGVLCPMHEHCARYHAAEGAPVETIGTCAPSEESDARPLFVERVQQGQGVATA